MTKIRGATYSTIQLFYKYHWVPAVRRELQVGVDNGGIQVGPLSPHVPQNFSIENTLCFKYTCEESLCVCESLSHLIFLTPWTEAV